MSESSGSSLKANTEKQAHWLRGIFQKRKPREEDERRRKKEEDEHWQKALYELRDATGENRMRVQVCPRGCGNQLARRDVVTRTRLSGKAEIWVDYKFEKTNCGTCGTPLVRK